MFKFIWEVMTTTVLFDNAKTETAKSRKIISYSLHVTAYFVNKISISPKEKFDVMKVVSALTQFWYLRYNFFAWNVFDTEFWCKMMCYIFCLSGYYIIEQDCFKHNTYKPNLLLHIYYVPRNIILQWIKVVFVQRFITVNLIK